MFRSLASDLCRATAPLILSLGTAALLFTARTAMSQNAVVVRVEGQAQVYSPPGAGAKVFAVVDGTRYAVAPAQVGAAVPIGSIVQTTATGKIRLVYSKGDFFTVGPNTMFRVFSRAKAAAPAKMPVAAVKEKAATGIDFLFGKLRAIILQDGPLSDLEVKTRTSVMGVRGTDFSLSPAEDGATGITVLRGRVEVRSVTAAPAAKPVVVNGGESLAPSGDPAKALPTPRATSKDELLAIHRETQVKRPSEAEIKSAAIAVPAAATVVAQLEQESYQATLSDIKVHDPEAYKVISASVPKETTDKVDVDALQRKSMAPLLKRAPIEVQAAPAAKRSTHEKKLNQEQLDEIMREDVYEKFK